MGGGLRTGFTTGTCAAAAAKAAALAASGRGRPASVRVALPRGGEIEVAVHSCEARPGGARCSVIKDGGDDPDVTHGAEIAADVELRGEPGSVEVRGGRGVGTVTKPGLGLEVGGPAINPVPRRMILRAVSDAGCGAPGSPGAVVTVSVPRGEDLAPRTDNPRLGILGGISILGTSGIVVPYSTASFAASVRQAISVAAAMGEEAVVLTTGGRSEEYASRELGLPDHCLVQMGDFAGYAVRECARRGLARAHVAGFVGKLSKMAAGTAQTHVKGSKVDTRLLARLAGECGAGARARARIEGANTARHALEIAGEEGLAGFPDRVCEEARGRLAGHARGAVAVDVLMFGFDGSLIGRARPP